MSGAESTRWILVVEDSSAMRSFIRTTVEEMGNVSVTEAASGFDALRVLPTRPFSLIITDINMPDINGLELIGYVKEHPHFSAIPMVIVSTEKTEEDRRRGISLGAAGYLVKPFAPGDLQALVARVLEEGPGPGPGKGRSGE
jgi:two-component system chemotaxis response regulator CheY